MTNWPVAPFGRETYSVFESRLPYKNKGVMAEWLMRGTVNTFFRGSIPLDAYYKYILFVYKLNMMNHSIKGYLVESGLWHSS